MVLVKGGLRLINHAQFLVIRADDWLNLRRVNSRLAKSDSVALAQ